MARITTSYQAGYRAGKYRPTTKNCHFQFFSTPEGMRDWEIGKQDGENSKKESSNAQPNQQN